MITLDQGGAARPTTQLVPIPPRLRSVVELAWVTPASTAIQTWRIVPDASPHLVWARYADGHLRLRFVGPRTHYVDINPSARTMSGGVRFRPGALQQATGLDAWDCRDRSLCVEEVWGPAGAVAFEQAQAAPNGGAVTTALLDLLEPKGWLDWRVRGLLHHFEKTPRARLGEVSASLGVGERTLRSVARTTLGLKPKELQRLVRLHKSLTLTLANVPDSGAAALAGYADQSHFIRESVALLGETPVSFRLRSGPPKSSIRPV